MDFVIVEADRPDEVQYAADATTLDRDYAPPPSDWGNPNVQGVKPNIQPGSLVRLKSGGPVMTVVKVNEDNHAHMHWFDEAGSLCEGRYINIGALHHVDPERDLIQEMQKYLIDIINEFETDPPENQFMEGYEAAMLDLYGDLFMTQEERAAFRSQRFELTGDCYNTACNSDKPLETQSIDSSTWTGCYTDTPVTSPVTGAIVTVLFTLAVIAGAYLWGAH